MALVLTEEQKMLQDAAHDFISENAPVSQLRELRDAGDDKGFVPALWASMADMGWTGTIISEDDGGLGFGYVGLGILFQEMGKTLCCSPMLSTAAMAAELIQQGADAERKQTLLADIIAGSRIVALAVEEGPHHQSDRYETQLQESALGELTVTGQKQQVIDGHVANDLLVAVEDEAHGGITLTLLDAEQPGVERDRVINLDSRPCARVQLNVAKVTGIIGERGKGKALLDRALDLGRVCLAAELLGISESVFQTTVEYLGTRKQFGVPIGSFQSLQHRAAHLYCEIELTRSAVLHALQVMDDSDANVRAAAASLAKAKAASTARLTTAEGVQMHGGIGMTDDIDMGLYMKRAKFAEATLGDFNFHADRYAKIAGF